VDENDDAPDGAESDEAAQQFAEEWRELHRGVAEQAKNLKDMMHSLTEHLTLHHKSGETEHTESDDDDGLDLSAGKQSRTSRSGAQTTQRQRNNAPQIPEKKPAPRHWYFGSRHAD
jgi:hypothetical protein